MDDSSNFQRPLPANHELLFDGSGVAEAADIPRPAEGVLLDEMAAQGHRKDRQDFGTLPRNLMEAVLLIQAMEREGRRVEKNREALMNYLKQQTGGDVISADLLTATALMLAAIPERRAKESASLGWGGFGRRGRSWWARIKRLFSFKS